MPGNCYASVVSAMTEDPRVWTMAVSSVAGFFWGSSRAVHQWGPPRRRIR